MPGPNVKLPDLSAPHKYEHQRPKRPPRLPKRLTPPPERVGPPDLTLFLYAGIVIAIVLVNTSRGPVVDPAALARALRDGEIFAAGLDVTEPEPLPADHPLWTLPGVLITPHTAGFGPYLDDRRFDILLDNCRRFLAGQPLRNVVDKPRWF